MSENRKSSQARIDANRRYMEKTYKKLQVMIKPDEYDIIDNYCNKSDISKARLIVEACKEYIDRHNWNVTVETVGGYSDGGQELETVGKKYWSVRTWDSGNISADIKHGLNSVA